MLLMSLFVLKVSWMTMTKADGETVMMKNILIVKVSFIKHMEIRNTEIHSLTKTILRTVFVSKVSPITMKTQSGDSVIIMIPATVRVSPMKLIMGIQSRMKMILTTLFVLKVSWMRMWKLNGETMMIKNLLIVKVSFIKHIMEIHTHLI